jgi:hypothetical protein
MRLRPLFSERHLEWPLGRSEGVPRRISRAVQVRRLSPWVRDEIPGAKFFAMDEIFHCQYQGNFLAFIFYKYGNYMKRPVIISRCKSLTCMLLLGPTVGFAADVVLQKAPPLTVREAPAYPENLARYHFGADVKATPESASPAKLRLGSNGQDQNTSVAALLCDDPTTGYQIPLGASSILISLPNIENIQSVSFLNDGALGDLTIAISNANVPDRSPEWHRIEKGAMSQGTVTAEIGPGEAKYVKLNFNITHSGRIAAFGVYATPALSDFTMPRPRKVSFEEDSASFALINFNFSDVHARARGLYVSSGDLNQVNYMIDDQPATAYQFANDDAAPTVVIDLGRERNLSRLAAIYASQPGSVDFYVLRSLPTGPSEEGFSNDASARQIANVGQGADLPASLQISEEVFAGMKPVGSVISLGEGHASVDFPEVVGRYVMLKWHPAAVQGEAFSIAQVAAFGPTKRTGSSAEEAKSDRQIDGKEAIDGKSILDNKDIPAEGPAEAPAEGPPPALPLVPPFTFIPQVPPTSP